MRASRNKIQQAVRLGQNENRDRKSLSSCAAESEGAPRISKKVFLVQQKNHRAGNQDRLVGRERAVLILGEESARCLMDLWGGRRGKVFK